MYIRHVAFSLLIVVAAFYSLSGCEYNRIGDTNGRNPQTLNQAREHWKSRNIQSYSVEVEQHCFCGGPIRYQMTVRNREVVEIIDLETGEQVEPTEGYRSISEWFDWLKQASAEDPVKLELEFDSRNGYPTTVNYDQSLQIADEELQPAFQNLARL